MPCQCAFLPILPGIWFTDKDLRIFTSKLDICKICHNGTVARDSQAPFFFFIWSHVAQLRYYLHPSLKGMNQKIFTAPVFFLQLVLNSFLNVVIPLILLFLKIRRLRTLKHLSRNVFFLRFVRYLFESDKIKLDRNFSKATCDFLRFIMQYLKTHPCSARQILQKHLFGFKSTRLHTELHRVKPCTFAFPVLILQVC